MAVILVFFAIYAPLLRVANITIDTQFFFFTIAIIYQAGKYTAITKAYCQLPIFRILFLLIVYSILINIAYFFGGEADPHTILRPVRAAVTALGCIAIFEYLHRKLGFVSNDRVIELILLAISMHGVLMIFQLFFPAFRDFIYSYTANDRAVMGGRYYYSMAGLSNGGGAQLSVYQSVGVIIAPLYYFIYPTKMRLLLSCLAFFVCLFSVFITGRTGILLAFVFTPIVLLINLGKNPTWKFLSALTLILFFIFSASAIFKTSQESDRIEFYKIFERLSSLDDGYESTSDVLSSQWILPKDGVTLFLGEPKLIGSDQSDEYRLVKSDIGYIRILHGYGVVGSFFHYLFYFYIIYIGLKKLKSAKISSGIGIGVGINVVFAFIILFSQAKEVFVLTRMGFTFTCLFAFVLFSNEIDVRRKVVNNV